MRTRAAAALAMRAVTAAALGWWLLLSMTSVTLAAPPDPLCSDAVTDDTLRPLPDSLVPAATRLFQLEAMPAEQIRRSTYFRCDAGRVLVCNTGANLPCGKANTGRQLPAAGTWCAEHPGSDFIPMYVTGHDTVHRWRCTGAKATAIGAPLKVDRRGFIARYWKRVNAAASSSKP